ncbi:hypothetical protein [Falsibacillus pallidus]|uniref:Uncharacterized protein n=1 Tax=Falsibacillus pallidus TaxID=493781 RepID=A0A370G4J3_9BACI|nr:hypothetical protein [Falsibacillus pallidus]RDI37946.1 hypothetical protein DFR59_12044 [Falsibacillus pallidus]
MTNESIHQLAEKHKKFMEQISVYPYEYHKNNKVYQMAHFYKLTSKLYWNFLMTPYDLSFEEAKDVFYSIILLEEYMKNKISKANEYASRDYSSGYFGYRNDIKRLIVNNPEFSQISNEVNSIVDSINYVEDALGKIRELYKEYTGILKMIESKGYFTDLQLNQLRHIFGECLAIQFEEFLVQKRLLEQTRVLYQFMGSYNLKGELKSIYKKTKLMVDEDSFRKVDGSLHQFGKIDELKEKSHDELIKNQIERYEKGIVKPLNEDFIKRRVRNPSVQEARG